MQDRPTMAELLEAVEEFIAKDIRPHLDAHRAFNARVAENILAIVRRELAMGPAADMAERARLVALLGHEGDLASLNRDLAAAIRTRSLAGRDREVLAHLQATVRDKLAIDNPKYARED